MITVRVRDRDIYPLPLWPITTSSVGIPVAFNFDRIWDGLAKIAVFRGSGVDKEVALLTDAAVVPHECLATAGGDLYIGVYGRSAYGDLVIPTIWGKAGHIYDGTVPADPDPADPTPEWSYQVQTAASEALRIASSLSLQGLPAGGSASQVLKKRSATDYDAEWADEEGGGGSCPEPYSSDPAALGTASPGSSSKFARGDHVHPKPSAADLGAIAAPSSPTSGQYLKWNGSAWVADNGPEGGSTLTQTAITLLQTILEAAVYTSDQSDNIDALIAELSGGSGGIEITYSGTTATITGLAGTSISYSGTTATVGGN